MAIDWLDLVQADFVHIQKDLQDKEELLEFLSDQFSRSPKLAKCKRADILGSLKGREEQGSTGLGGGIAAPHCGLKKADGFVISILTLARGIDFGAFDSIPCNFIIAIVGPEAERSQHVQILASLASGLQKVEEVEALLACRDPDLAMDILGRIFSVNFRSEHGSSSVRQPCVDGEYSRLTIFIQKEKFFVPLLEEAVRASEGSVTVLEAHNVSGYLQRMPLYAFILNDKKMNHFFRCIEAIVPNTELASIYDTVRRIDKKIEKKPGILLFHQEIQGILGSLDY
ncbi:MAG: PTS sugar transporter subunit IIA [Spirochaetota bacterium]